MTKPLVIITGASSGIGAATANIFSQSGYPLALLARNKQAMEKLNLPESLCLEVDITDYQSLQEAIQSAEVMYGPTDCLINCAGTVFAGDFVELSHEQHEQTIKVNLNGLMNGIEIVLPGMRERKTGTIINISSLADRCSRPNIASYAASKAAVKSLTESLRMANARYGIRFCNLAPAKIDTPMVIKAQIHDDQIIPVEDFAKAILWVYQQPQNICIRDMVFSPTAYEA